MKNRSANLTAGSMALVVVLTGLGCLAAGAALAVLAMRARLAAARRRDKERAMENKQIKALMYALAPPGGDSSGGGGNGGGKGGAGGAIGGSFTGAGGSGGAALHGGAAGYERLKAAEEFAFVVTDIQDSTELSQQDPAAFQQLQEIHDAVMREAIARTGGYEIITEGDSFSVAFTSAPAAAAFCLEAQYRLLETSWPGRVLRLKACRPVRGAGGELALAGPRVRMGLHWARRGTVAHRVHSVTRHRVFAGPGMQVGEETGVEGKGEVSNPSTAGKQRQTVTPHHPHQCQTQLQLQNSTKQHKTTTQFKQHVQTQTTANSNTTQFNSIQTDSTRRTSARRRTAARCCSRTTRGSSCRAAWAPRAGRSCSCWASTT